MQSSNVTQQSSVELDDTTSTNDLVGVDVERQKNDVTTHDGQLPLAVQVGDEKPDWKRSNESDSTGTCDDEKSVDPWDLVEEDYTEIKWSELTFGGKVWRVVWIAIRLCVALGLLYLFVCSLDILQDSFQLLSGRVAGEIFTSSIISNPVCGLMVGVFVTVLVQSSSTSTSIVVSMVGSSILDVKTAIPIIMGANIGTTVTNTLVALTQSPDRDVFRRAFAGATVHDMFNWLTVLILLPLEVASGYLFHMTEAMTKNVGSSSANSDNPQFLKVITDPLTKMIIQVDKKVITAIAENKDRQKFPLVRYYCKEVSAKHAITFTDAFNETAYDIVNNEIFTYNVQRVNTSDGYEQLKWTQVLDFNSTKCAHWFVGCGLPGAALSEKEVGGILLALSLVVLMACLIGLVKILNSLLRGPMRIVVRRYINADFPGYAAFLTGYVAMLCGAGITVLVQSSSVFTSALTPLVGIGVVTVERVYPLTLGSNIGTTVTGILAALTADANMIRYTLQVALCHLFFNITGIAIWYPIPFMRNVPISLAKKLGNTTAKYRWFAVVYLILMFLLLPLVVFGLSMAGWYVLLAVGVPFLIIVAFAVVVNTLQNRRPNWLPGCLRNWDFLPRPLHSFEPYDGLVTACLQSVAVSRCSRCCSSCSKPSNAITPSTSCSVVDGSRRLSSSSVEKSKIVAVDVEVSTANQKATTGVLDNGKGVINRSFTGDELIRNGTKL